MKKQSQNCWIVNLLLFLFLSPSLLHLAAGQQTAADSWLSDGNYAYDSGHVNPSSTVIVIILVFVFFVTGFISLYIRQCADSSIVVGAPITADTGAKVRGVDQSLIETFPTFLYSEVKESKLGKGSLECAICLNEFEEDESLRLLPKCDHVFHSECIDAWLAGHSTCPVCRADLAAAADPIQIGTLAESTHELGSTAEADASSGERISSCEVRIEIGEGNRKLERSHSTGHSLSQPRADDSERFTLKLPAEVRRQLMARTKLKRATSLLALPRETSSRRGYRAGAGEGSGSSRYGRIIGRSISRMVSFKWPAAKVRDDGEVTEACKGKGSLSSSHPL